MSNVKSIDEFYSDESINIGKIDNPNFAGVLVAIWDDVSKHWNENTAYNYLKDYNKYIFPDLQDIGFVDCTIDDYNRVMDGLKDKKKAEGRVYNASVERHIEYIIALVTRAAANSGICPDVLWGSKYRIEESSKQEDICADELVRHRKSLTIKEEQRICDAVLTDPTQIGENFGLAEMFCLGVRNNEACALRFGVIKRFDCDHEKFAAWIYKTSNKDSRNDKFSGKTANSPRVVPIPNRLSELILKRKEYIQNKVACSDEEINRFPVACVGEEFKKQCKPSELGYAGTALLRKSDVDERMMSLIDDDICGMERKQNFEQDFEDGVIEKDPTAYLFRRNVATHLYLLGLEPNEIQYIIGHKIDDIDDARNYFRNEEKLYKIGIKMWQRPLVNESETLHVTAERHIYLENAYRANIEEKVRGNIRIRVAQREPYCNTEITVSGLRDGQYITYSNEEDFPSTTNILGIYHNRYDSYQNNKDEATDNNE